MHFTMCGRTGAVLLLFAASVFGAPKDIPRPPVGDDLSVEVMRGGSTVITLKAYEGRNNPLAYEITGKPEHGRLAGFRQADGNRQGFASVVYTHGDDEASTADSFAFRARAVTGGGASRPIKVGIRVIDSPPRLAAPQQLDFAAIAGENDVRVISLTNAGGAILEGRLAPSEPFFVVGDGYFRLGRGQSTKMSIRFSPRSMAAVAMQKLSPAPADPSGVIVLNAKAEEPFAAKAGVAEVQPDGAREGIISLTNFSAAPLDLSVGVQPGDIAEVPAKVRIAGKRTAEIPVRIGAEKKGGALDLEVEISNGFGTQRLTLAMPPVPPRLAVLTSKLDFREQNEAELQVTNSGGVMGRFTLDLPEGIRPVDRALNFPIEPGEMRAVRLQQENAGGAPAGDTVVVDLGTEGKIPVPLEFAVAKATPPPVRAKPMPASGLVNAAHDAPPENAGDDRTETQSPEPSPCRIMSYTPMTSAKTRATLQLVVEAPPEVTGYRLERCEISVGNKPSIQPVFKAIRHEGGSTAVVTGRAKSEDREFTLVKVSADGLTPGTGTFWRLVPLAGETVLPPTAEFLISTVSPGSFSWRGFFLWVLVAFLGAILWLMWKSRRLPGNENPAGKIR